MVGLFGAGEEDDAEGEEEGEEEDEAGEEEGGKEEEEGASGGLKELEPREVIEEVAAGGSGGRRGWRGGAGGFGCDPWVEGGGRPCMGREPSQLAQRANPPLGAGSTGHWLLPQCPPFFDAQGAIITMGSAFRRLLRHRIRNKGAKGGPGSTQGGAWAWKPLPGKLVSPFPEPIGSRHLTQAKVFMGLRGASMRGSHLELCFLYWDQKGWVKLQRSGRKF